MCSALARFPSWDSGLTVIHDNIEFWQWTEHTVGEDTRLTGLIALHWEMVTLPDLWLACFQSQEPVAFCQRKSTSQTDALLSVQCLKDYRRKSWALNYELGTYYAHVLKIQKQVFCIGWKCKIIKGFYFLYLNKHRNKMSCHMRFNSISDIDLHFGKDWALLFLHHTEKVTCNLRIT